MYYGTTLPTWEHQSPSSSAFFFLSSHETSVCLVGSTGNWVGMRNETLFRSEAEVRARQGKKGKQKNTKTRTGSIKRSFCSEEREREREKKMKEASGLGLEGERRSSKSASRQRAEEGPNCIKLSTSLQRLALARRQAWGK